MKRRAVSKVALIAGCCVLSISVGAAPGEAQSARPPDTLDNASPANGDVAELEALTRDGKKIITLRKTVNGSYGATLAYYREQMTYYAAMFQLD